MNKANRVRGPWTVAPGIMLLCLAVAVSAAEAPKPAADAAPKPAADAAPKAKAADEEEEEEEDLSRGAELNRDFEADRLLRRVRELLENSQPQFRDVVVLLQNLIDRPGDAFACEEGSVYRPVRHVAERLLAGLGAAGLDAYRMEADGQAKAILGQVAGNRDEEALRTVTRQYFLSSHGDDAAYLLACLYLDQCDFAKARRLLTRLLAEHPDPSVPKADALLRLALACRRCGDLEGARAAWKRLEAALPLPSGEGGGEGAGKRAGLLVGALTLPSPGGRGNEVIEAVRLEVTQETPEAAPAQETTRPTPRGLFPALPTSAIEMPRGLCIPAWQHAISLIPRDLPPNSFGQLNEQFLDGIRDRILGRWETSALVPSAGAILREGALLLKTHGTLTCLDPATGQVRWQTPAPKADPNTRVQIHTFSHLGFGHPIEMLQFDDQMGRAMRVIGESVYQIEEYYQNRWGPNRFGIQMFIGRNQPGQPKQATGNCLAAYDVRTGKALWRVGRSLDEKDPLGAVQFLAAPAASGSCLVVPVERRGELWLAGLAPSNGRCLWETFLCSYVVPRGDSWRLVGLAVQGSDVYVASGQGFIFALDGTDGSLHWASQYGQDWDRSTPNPFGQGGIYRGWQKGLTVLDGGKLIVLPSDAECVLVLDTASGKVTARHATAGLDYCLGLDGAALYAGSSTCVRRLDVPTGRTVWERKLEGAQRACGHGLLTPDALFVPSGRNILRLDPQRGDVQATLCVATEDDEPVGNLLCDGTKLIALGVTRAYALTNAAPRLAEAERRVADLEKQLAALPEATTPPQRRYELLRTRAEAQLARARLLLKYDRVEEAAADLKAALRYSSHGKLVDDARHELVECLATLAERQPQQRLEHLREAHAAAKGSADEGRVVLPLVEAHRGRGELEQAVELLLQLAKAGKGSTIALAADTDTWKASPVAAAAGAIQRLLSQDRAQVAPLLARKGEAAMAAARAGNDADALRTILRLYPGTPAAVEAGLKAAAVEAASGVFEKAEVLLREMARSKDTPMAAAGLAALADLHQKKGWLSQARGEWTLLAARFPNVAVSLDGKAKAGSALAAERLADKALAEADPDMFRGTPEPPWRLAWEADAKPGTAYPVRIRQVPHMGVLDFSQFLEQHIFLQRHGPESRLICRRLRDGQTVYEAKLGQAPNLVYFQGQAANRDGHVAVLQGNNLWEGFGLVSGKSLWSRKEAAPQRSVGYVSSIAWRMNFRPGPGGWPADTAGCVVVRPNQQTVRVMELATGEDWWERTFRRRQVTWAQEAGRYVLLALEGGECWVCDSLSGDRVGSFAVDDGQRIGYPRSLQVTRQGALYQNWQPGKAQNTIAMLELPSGKTLWSIDLGAEYRVPMVLNDEVFYFTGSKGMEVRELATGKVRFAVPSEKVPGNLANVALSADGKTLGFCAYDGTGKMRLGTLDLATGRVVQGEGTGIQVYGGIDMAEVWARSGDLIPWMTMDPPIKEGNNMRYTNLRNVGFTRKSDGKVLEGHKLPSPRADGKFENINQLFVQDGMVVLARHNGLQVFGHDPNPPKEAKTPDDRGQKAEKK